MYRRTIIAALSLVLSVGAASGQSGNFRIGKWMETQNYIVNALNKVYVDTLPIDKMQRAAIDAMLAELDPYTIYVPEEEVEDFTLQIGGIYGGIGAIISKKVGEGVFINEPYAGTPCVKAGMEAGDEIILIDGEDVKPLDSKKCSDMMKGQPGSTVDFLVRKVHTGDTVAVRVRREQIHLSSVEYAGMLDESTGYILQTGFNEGVGQTIRDKVVEMKAQGMKKLILDLRGNGGGLLTEAVEIVSIFVPKNTLVVTSRGRDGVVRETYRTKNQPVDLDMPVVVLADGGSASSSEIVSGALQDLDRATIMGQRTFGKGLVQSVLPLPYGGQLKVTVAKYYTPSGRCVQAIDYSHREDGKPVHVPDSLTHEFKTSRGRIVRDGGGITPDVALEIPKYDDIVYSLVYAGIPGQYALKYKIEHDSIPSAEEFHFADYEDFVRYAKTFLKEDAWPSLERLDPAQIIPFIEEEIVTRYYFRSEGIKVRLRYDKMLQQAEQSKLIWDK